MRRYVRYPYCVTLPWSVISSQDQCRTSGFWCGWCLENLPNFDVSWTCAQGSEVYEQRMKTTALEEENLRLRDEAEDLRAQMQKMASMFCE